MAKLINGAIGFLVVFIWIWIVAHLSRYFPNIASASSSNIASGLGHGGGSYYVVALPFVGAAFLIFPDFFVAHFSPFSKFSGEPVLSQGFWYLCGYFSLIISWALLQFFK
ncbi:hypothetical protein HDE78_003606 [Rhodanobacter sp. K2T2]|uniref:hypothetical protein n=1 Tax=Rhodanobacter sp. K2T2 TaxID=2723085 RepID=UPI0015C96EC8|nr:hypothetical protein [Rhodanobacter sp. K2T2]NYE30631.1 hypothetical protein [Rhodanobacter sp. K2T2]